jgi:hypothetical protein
MNMIENRIAKQVLDFQKTAIDNTFNMIFMLQDQAEKTFSTYSEASIA